MRAEEHRHDRGRRGYHGGLERRAYRPYWGWSAQSGQMEMMDLAEYVDAYRAGYQQAMEEYQNQWSTMVAGMAPAAGQLSSWAEAAGRGSTGPMRHHHGRHEHSHGGHRCEHCGHEHHDECCGCEHDHRPCDHHDCTCECCVSGDADIVVNARCGEIRIITIEIENDTRRAREDVTFEVGDVRTSGGRSLPWVVRLDQQGPVTLEPCSRTTLLLEVAIRCGDNKDDVGESGASAPSTRRGAARASASESAAAERAATNLVDVDHCEVGYATVTVKGCLLRPIVVAIAVLPRQCGAHRVTCSCSCCC
jgi:hypothetical protein